MQEDNISMQEDTNKRVVKGGLDHVSRKIKESFHNSRKIK